ncbi:MAG TPA: OmpA family protein [Tepidisphaeraceae bacterium]|jgi:outer membrane protein OmpA-like peptidoglycan-associated protein|nr:OmpA family protein [Tepidisphaeraceae bacterium]
MSASKLIVTTLSSLMLVGCANKEMDALTKQNRELQSNYDRLRSENADLQSRLAAAPDASQLSSLQGEVASRDAKIKELEDQLRKPTPGAGDQPGIEGIETTYDAAAGTMTVNLPGDVLFASGQDTLKPSARATLDKIASAIKNDYAGKRVRVEGHTDTDPISKTKDKYVDNLDLSLNRAAAVTRYLETRGLSPKQITTSGYGPSRPRGDKAASRRVEIVVVTR